MSKRTIHRAILTAGLGLAWLLSTNPSWAAHSTILGNLITFYWLWGDV